MASDATFDSAVADLAVADQVATEAAASDGPPVDISTTIKWTLIDSSEASTCGLRSSGKLYCWGKYTLGTGTNTPESTPKQVVSPPGFGGTWVHLAISDQSGCAIDNLGQGFCWGNDSNGELGNGAPNADSLVPVKVNAPAGFSGKWASMSVGDFFACGIDSKGKGYCWGRGDYGILGDGSSGVDRPWPAAISSPTGFSGAWSVIVCGHVNSCGVDSSGKGFCWGFQIGTKPVAVPSPVGFSGKWQAIHTGNQVSCGLSSDGTLYCWGDDYGGSLGNGPSLGSKATPFPIASTKKFKMIGLDGESVHVCALSTAGEILCWGENLYGEVGVASGTKNVQSPLALTSPLKFVHVAIGELISCGIDTTGAAHCWGLGTGGALGDGKNTDSHLPVKVLTP